MKNGKVTEVTLELYGKRNWASALMIRKKKQKNFVAGMLAPLGHILRTSTNMFGRDKHSESQRSPFSRLGSAIGRFHEAWVQKMVTRRELKHCIHQWFATNSHIRGQHKAYKDRALTLDPNALVFLAG